MRRVYQAFLEHHLDTFRQMAFVSGPRQAGKTTACRALEPAPRYLNWDDLDHRRILLAGPTAIATYAGADRLGVKPPVVLLDEIHKHGRWKTLLKGLFDSWQDALRIMVTGSSRLDVYRRGGDSLMGRYFRYRLHPLSVAELLDQRRPESPLRPPARLDDGEWNALWEHGGFPEPFLRRDPEFSARWRLLRRHQLIREDLRDLTRVAEVDRLEALADILSERSGTQFTLSHLANDVHAAVDTVRRWIPLLESLHHCFVVRPWAGRLATTLRKEPKVYWWDWSIVADPGRRLETLVACHLLKAVHAWEDLGFGRFSLHYVRDKAHREVDFLVVRDRKPWFLVEVKTSEGRASQGLTYFHERLGTKHAFHAVLAMDQVDRSCFTRANPVVVPLKTLLSQLV
jgi:predicted AAA+ superfamily ATPase